MTIIDPAARPPFRALLVDDEPPALRRLARLLDATGRFDIRGSIGDPEEAARFLSRERVEVLFLDIELPGMNGFELLARVAEPPFVIFTTAFDDYALRAFEFHSIDYLLKPIEPPQLERALRKLDQLHAPQRQPDWRALAAEIASAMRPPSEFPARIPSRLGDRIQLVDLAEVTHFVADDKVTYAVGAAKKAIVDYSLAELEQRLDPHRFVRIHRAILLNSDYVEELHHRLAGRARVRLRDGKGTQLPVARDRLRALKKHLGI